MSLLNLGVGDALYRDRGRELSMRAEQRRRDLERLESAGPKPQRGWLDGLTDVIHSLRTPRRRALGGI